MKMKREMLDGLYRATIALGCEPYFFRIESMLREQRIVLPTIIALGIALIILSAVDGYTKFQIVGLAYIKALNFAALFLYAIHYEILETNIMSLTDLICLSYKRYKKDGR